MWNMTVNSSRKKRILGSLSFISCGFFCVLVINNSKFNFSELAVGFHTEGAREKIERFNDSQYTQVLSHIPFCGNCSKKIRVKNHKENVLNTEKTPLSCYAEAQRGSGQRVVAYSYYDGPETSDKLNRNFFEGIRQNLEGINTLYKNIDSEEWTMRLYFQLYPKSKHKEELCEIACSQSNLDICEVPYSNKVFPMIWRFFPLLSKNVDVFNSRDLDSRITPREVSAVEEFLKSNKDIHIMRDHPHHGVAILGGMWGAKLTNPASRKKIGDAFKKILKDRGAYASRKTDQHDQNLLKKYIWPMSAQMRMQHDSYFCKKFPYSRPFPTQRRDEFLNFIGAVADINNIITFEVKNRCPKYCRPKNHTDWLYC